MSPASPPTRASSIPAAPNCRRRHRRLRPASSPHRPPSWAVPPTFLPAPRSWCRPVPRRGREPTSPRWNWCSACRPPSARPRRASSVNRDHWGPAQRRRAACRHAPGVVRLMVANSAASVAADLTVTRSCVTPGPTNSQQRHRRSATLQQLWGLDAWLPVFGKPNCGRCNGARRTPPNRPPAPTRVTPQSQTSEPQQECEDTILIPAALAAAALAGVGILAAPPGNRRSAVQELRRSSRRRPLQHPQQRLRLSGHARPRR
jgi:hypothetical protein